MYTPPIFWQDREVKIRKVTVKRAVILIIGAAVVGGVFWLSRQHATPGSAPSAAAHSSNTAGGVTESWTEANATQHQNVGTSPGCSADFHYPVMAATGGVSRASAEAINAAVQKALVGQVATLITDFDAGSSADTAAQAFLKHCSRDLALYVAQAGDATEGWDASMQDQVTQDTDGIFAVTLVFNWYMGGAHSNGSGTYLNFDVKTGKPLALTDVIAKDKVLDFEVAEKTALLKDNTDGLFPEDLVAFHAFLSSPDVATADTFLADHPSYSLSPDALTTHYDPYEIAPYTTGPIDVTIPRSELVGILQLP